jgi:penicillin-binding protein activator
MPNTPRRVAGAALAVLTTLTAGACNNKRVARIDPTSVTDLSGRWNDTDSRLVASALVEQALGAPWLGRASSARGGRPPAVIVGGFKNATMEHIPVATFTRARGRA